MAARHYNVTLVQPPEYLPAMGLWDVCRLLHESFRTLGYDSRVGVNQLDPNAVNVVVGYHLLNDPGILSDFHIILYQLEQLSLKEGHFTPQRLAILKRAAEVWDYSEENVAFLRSQGVTRVKHVPIGYHSALDTIPTGPAEIDVMFYGLPNPRREEILARLRPKCRVEAFWNLYPPQRDQMIAQSKIVLNIHYYEAQIMEQVRVSYLLNNGRFVISENSPINPYDGMLVTADYDQLVDRCMEYLQDEPARQAVALRGRELFRQRPMIEYIKPVIAIEPPGL